MIVRKVPALVSYDSEAYMATQNYMGRKYSVMRHILPSDYMEEQWVRFERRLVIEQLLRHLGELVVR